MEEHEKSEKAEIRNKPSPVPKTKYNAGCADLSVTKEDETLY